jgi:hypothetical protein
MVISQIVNQVGLILANLLLTIGIIYLTFRKYENKNQVKMPKPVIVLLLTYTLIYLISFLAMGKINILFVILYLIIFFSLIVLLILSIDNFDLKKKIKNLLLKILR